MRDVRYAIRALLKSPGFAAVTVCSLALCIGASTALLSVVDAVLFRSLPVPDPGRLVLIKLGGWGDSAPYRFLESLTTGSGDVLDHVAAYGTRAATVGEAGTPERIEAAFVSGAFFSTLGITAAHGRVLTDVDERDGVAGGVVISHGFWQRRFAGDPGVLGRALRINTHSFPIVGVMPAGFFGTDVGRPIDVYLPVTAAASIGTIDPVLMTGYSSTWLRLIGRLRSGVETGTVSARLTVLLQQYLTRALDELERGGEVSAATRERLRSWRVSVEPLGHGYGPTIRSRLATPLAIAGALIVLLLVLVVANVGSLVLGRAVDRQRDIVIRESLGATRAQVMRPILVEGALVVACGGIAALLLTPALATVIVRWLPSDLGPVFLDVSLDWRLLAAAVVLMGVLTCLITLAALAYVARQGPTTRLTATAPGVTARVRIGAQRALIVVQVGVSVVVLSAAVLLVQTLRNLGAVDLGYSQAHVLVASIDPRSVGYADDNLQRLYRRVQERLAVVPEISSASVIVGRPFLLRRASDVEVAGQRASLRWEVVGPNYFNTLGMAFESGRDFTDADVAAAQHVVIVNEQFANQYFPGRNPVGEYIYRLRSENGRTIRIPTEIVGMVRDVIHRSPRDRARAVLYGPIAQETFAMSPAAVVARSRVTPVQLEQVVQRAVAEIDPNLALFDVKTFEQQVDESIWAERLLARVSTGFGATALVLVGLGLFGTLSQAVTRRTKEIAVRMAIGADAGRIQWGVVRDGVVLYAAGAVLGIPMALAATGYFRSLLFGIEPINWRVSVAVVLLLGTTAALAAYLPARRASRVDPMQVLRAE